MSLIGSQVILEFFVQLQFDREAFLVFLFCFETVVLVFYLWIQVYETNQETTETDWVSVQTNFFFFRYEDILILFTYSQVALDNIWTPALKFWSTREGVSSHQLGSDPYSLVYVNRSGTWLKQEEAEQYLTQDWLGIKTVMLYNSGKVVCTWSFCLLIFHPSLLFVT
jgi:hypothetical protein